MKTTHEEHIKGGYFQKGCDECAKFVGHGVMKGHLKPECDVVINGHTVTLIVFECNNCQGALGIDTSHLDQHSDEIKCPYCGVTHKVLS